MNHTSKFILVNIITILRIALIPLFYITGPIQSFILLNFLFITDYIDGLLSRKFGVTSKIGALLDLIGDKTLTIFLLIIYTQNKMLPFWISFLLIIREIYSIVMRFYYLRNNKGLIEASIVGKAKTFLFFIAFDALILNIPGYKLLFFIVLIISYYSLFTYVKEGVRRR